MEMLLAVILIFIGSFVQSTIGFGLAIITAPLLFQLSPDYVPAPIIIVALFISLVNTWQYKSAISMTGLWSALLGRVPGSIAGAAVLFYVDTQQLSLLLGVLVIMAVLLSLAPWKIQPTPWRLAIAGFFSGLFGTSSSIGGPPMALILQHQKAQLVRANLSAFFLFSCIMSLAMQVPIGYLNQSHLSLALPLLPSALLGFLVARRYADLMPKAMVRNASLLLCFAAGLTAVLNGLSTA